MVPLTILLQGQIQDRVLERYGLWGLILLLATLSLLFIIRQIKWGEGISGLFNNLRSESEFDREVREAQVLAKLNTVAYNEMESHWREDRATDMLASQLEFMQQLTNDLVTALGGASGRTDPELKVLIASLVDEIRENRRVQEVLIALVREQE